MLSQTSISIPIAPPVDHWKLENAKFSFRIPTSIPKKRVSLAEQNGSSQNILGNFTFIQFYFMTLERFMKERANQNKQNKDRRS